MYNTLGFTDKVARDEEYAKIKATGARGCVRYTTHDQNHPQIIYVLAYPVSEKTHIGTKTEVLLTDAAASDMIAEGGNTDAETTISENSANAGITETQPAEIEPAPKA